MLLDRKLHEREIIKRVIYKYIVPHKMHVFLAIFSMISVAVCTALTIRMTKPAIDEVFLNHNRNMLVIISLSILAIHFVKAIAEYFQGYLVKYLGQKILIKIQMQLYKHLLFADLLFLQSQPSGHLISRCTNDIILMRTAILTIFVGVARHFLSMLFLIIVMFNLSLHLSTLILIIFPVIILPIQKIGRKMRTMTAHAQEELGNFTAKLDESFKTIKIVKSFCGEAIEAKKAQKITDKLLSFYQHTAKLDSLTPPIMDIISGLAITSILWYGGQQVINGQMSTGDIFAFIAAFITAYKPFKGLLILNTRLQEGLAAANRIFNIIDFKPQITDPKESKKFNITQAEVKLQNVRVNFANKAAISFLNLTMKSGQTYAIIGKSGSGKTTIANLLVRFFDPTAGEIFINQVNIKNLSLAHLRKNIAIVTQDVALFNLSVADNIAYGLENTSREEIIKAAQDADADEFITALPDGYDTLIGDSLIKLSGGQKQKISVARSLLKKAPILLLDEATSSLDPASEYLIIDNLKKLKKNKIIIIITHRLSNLANIDQIIVMKKGEICEQGTHKQLLAKKTEYYELCNKQLKDKDRSV